MTTSKQKKPLYEWIRQHKFLTFIIVLIGLAIIGSIFDSTPQEQRKDTKIKIGEEGFISSPTAAAASTVYLDQFYKARAANDEIGQIQLLNNNQVIVLNTDTPVLVIDAKYPYKKVRVTNGTYYGLALWVSYDHVRK